MQYKNIAIVAMLGACGTALAQVDPPPTWGQDDGVSLSLSYLFTEPTLPPVEDTSVAWDGWGGTAWSKSMLVTHMDTLTDHAGVWGLEANNTTERLDGILSVIIKNGILKPEKQVWYQFDLYVGPNSEFNLFGSTETGYTIGDDTSSSQDLGQGWERVTGTFTIKPQPPWERLDFEFTTWPGGGPVAIDNFHFHSHCVPTPTGAGLLAFSGITAAIRRRR